MTSTSPAEPIFHELRTEFAAGVIDVIFASDTIAPPTAPVPIRSLDTVPEHDTRQLRKSCALVTDLKELQRLSEAYRTAGFDLIPFVHYEAGPGECDPVALISAVAGVAARYVLVIASLGLRRFGRYAQCDVTVIVPVYGVADYVADCANSLSRQDFAGRLQVLFIDDGSPDGSAGIVQKIIDNSDGRADLQLLHKPNGGAASARNYGLERARGEFIAFVDGDDYVSERFVDVLYRAAILNDADVSQAQFAFVDAASGEITAHTELFPVSPGPSGPVAAVPYRLMRQTPGIWRRLYSANLLAASGVGFNEEFRRHDDLPFNIEVLSRAKQIAIARETVYFYRLGRDGQDVGATDERLLIHFRLLDFARTRVSHRYWTVDFYCVYLIVMMGHHLWAYDRVRRDLRGRYFRGMAQQVFREPAPVDWATRLLVLARHFPDRRLMILRLALVASLLPMSPLPSDLLPGKG